MANEVDFHPEYAGMIARAILNDFKNDVDKIEVAGGLRRKQPRVRGVSIVYISRVIKEVKNENQGDLFGGFKRTVTGKNVYLVEEKLKTLDYLEYRKDEEGEIITPVKHPFRFKALINPQTGIPVDLFPVQTIMEWGVALTLKTGPARYALRMEAAAKRQGYRCDGHRLFQFSDRSYVPVTTEEEFFRLCHVRFIPPEER
jgi:DNA polymerase/3'-5' exonuclease PolX